MTNMTADEIESGIKELTGTDTGGVLVVSPTVVKVIGQRIEELVDRFYISFLVPPETMYLMPEWQLEALKEQELHWRVITDGKQAGFG